MVQWLTNQTRNHEVAGSDPALAQWVKGSGFAISCGVGCRYGSDLVLLWLWLWLWLAPVALIGPLAWAPPHAAGVALKSKKNPTKTEKQKQQPQKTNTAIKNTGY